MPVMRPCTPYGIILMMERAGLEIKGRNAVVVGRSNIVGKPMALELLMKNATVTVCHSGTRDLASFVGSAEILVVSVGKAGFVPGAWVKPGAVVIDVGINRLPDGRLVGDVQFDEAAKRAGHITPVPGGVGPMTIAALMKNTLESAERRLGNKRGQSLLKGTHICRSDANVTVPFKSDCPLLFPPPGRSVRPVLEQDAGGGEFVAYPVGLGPVALAPRLDSRGHLAVDCSRIKRRPAGFPSARERRRGRQPFRRRMCEQPDHAAELTDLGRERGCLRAIAR